MEVVYRKFHLSYVLKEIRIKKSDVDDKLEEVLYEEKQIINKRQASEYILLYIELLESLEG